MRFGALENRHVGARAHIEEKGQCSALKSNLAALFSRVTHTNQESRGDVSDPPVAYSNASQLATTATCHRFYGQFRLLIIYLPVYISIAKISQY